MAGKPIDYDVHLQRIPIPSYRISGIIVSDKFHPQWLMRNEENDLDVSQIHPNGVVTPRAGEHAPHGQEYCRREGVRNKGIPTQHEPYRGWTREIQQSSPFSRHT